LKACTYDVQVKPDPHDGTEQVYMETPEGGSNWRLVELRPVSEGSSSVFFCWLNSTKLPSTEFADPPSATLNEPLPFIPTEKRAPEPVVPLVNPPTTLMQWAVLILNTPSPTLKVFITIISINGR
jgi:hypothetical protein